MAERYKILIVEDEEDLRHAVADAFEIQGQYDCLQAKDGVEAFARVREEPINLVLTDLHMPRMDGAALLEAIRGYNPEIPVLVMTGFGTVESAVELLKKGAYDYITKPFQLEELHGRVARALERLRLIDEIRSLKQAVEERGGVHRPIGSSAAMMKVLRQLQSVARSEAAVILYGESGTGKEVVARSIHGMSGRASRPFVTVNCGALPESLLENELFGHMRGAFTDARENYAGLIREADGGTLLLDEIGEMTPATQVKILRFLQEKEYRPLGSSRTVRVNVRIIAATNRDLKKAIGDGSFREDLYYRLNIIPLTLPPLRERKEDIPLLVNHFLKRFAQEMQSPVESVSPLALQKLMSYDWPGNVRELENKIQQVVALSPTNVVLPEQVDLPASETIARADGRLKSYREAKREVVTAFEVGYVTKLLAMTAGNISEAARLARKHRRAFWEIMKKHGIKGRMSAAPVETREEALVG
jgi:DNA-binding NtrC family response regulator